jgi:hypothetical protein
MDPNDSNQSVKLFGYRLEDRANVVKLPAGARDISVSRNVQTETDVHLTSSSVVNKSFPLVRKNRVVTSASYHHLVPR